MHSRPGVASLFGILALARPLSSYRETRKPKFYYVFRVSITQKDKIFLFVSPLGMLAFARQRLVTARRESHLLLQRTLQKESGNAILKDTTGVLVGEIARSTKRQRISELAPLENVSQDQIRAGLSSIQPPCPIRKYKRRHQGKNCNTTILCFVEVAFLLPQTGS